MEGSAGVQGGALGHGVLHLLVHCLGCGAGRQWAERTSILRGRVPGNQTVGLLGETGHEIVVDILHDDHALIGVAGLAGVFDPGVPGQLGRCLDVLGVQHHVGI